MIQVDLNCDVGEGAGNDAAIIPNITSANIACGFHAGDEDTIRETVCLAKKNGVAMGAHPSFADRENFGRTELPATPQEVYALITEQLEILQRIIAEYDVSMHHIKPHGALYNMAARDAGLAKAIVAAVIDFDANLILFGLSGSHLISEAKAAGLKTGSEVFADRTYLDDGTLTPRTRPDALIKTNKQAVQQALQMVKRGCITTTNGKEISIIAETVCLHGDGHDAVGFARTIRQGLMDEGIVVKAL